MPARGLRGELRKDAVTSVSEDFNLHFRAELFNILNHPNFDDPGASVFGSSPGVPRSAVGCIRSTVTTSRQIQFGLKITFDI